MTIQSFNLGEITAEVSRALTVSQVMGRSGYITTSASYPNGSRIVIRIDQHGDDEFFVYDDGRGFSQAEMLGGLSSFNRIAAKTAEQAGVGFDRHSFFAAEVTKGQLPAAVVAVANASHRAIERTIYTLEERRVSQSREIFVDRIKDAFGGTAAFDVEVVGRSGREWRMDAAVIQARSVSSAFVLVRPSTMGVANAHLKCSDVKQLLKPPHLTVALTDYQRTSPELRLILSSTADAVIAANDDRATYIRAA